MPVRAVRFVAILSLALYLVPSGAHLIALPNKAGLDDVTYLAVQQIYRGWALAGLVLVVALVSTGMLAFLSRVQRRAFLLAAVGFGSLVASAVTFFVLVFPANQATGNWTRVPPEFPALRSQWEAGHAIAAVLVLLALIATVLACLAWCEVPPSAE